MDTQFFSTHRERFANQLEEHSLAIFFAGQAPQSSGDQLYPFVPNRNFYYLSGIEAPHIIFVMAKFNDTITEHLFVERPNPIMAKWIGESMTPEKATDVSGISNVEFLEDFRPFIQNQLLAKPYEHLYLDLEKRNWDAPQTPAQAFAQEVSNHYPSVQLHNVYHTICDMRLIKTQEEIAEIKEAGRITSEGIKHLMRNAKPGMKEYELEAYFDFILKKHGVKHHAFNTIAASGMNATVLHYENNHDTVNDGELVLLDLGAQWNHYNGDISYTFPINGKFTERQKAIYEIVLKALHEISDMIRPGVPFADLQAATRRFLAEACIKIGLIDHSEDISDYYFHGVSHSLGLDTHDVGAIREKKLEPGMVITVEPGLYIPEEGIGVRIENDIAVTETGHENLTPDLPRTVEEIEAFLAEKRSY